MKANKGNLMIGAAAAGGGVIGNVVASFLLKRMPNVGKYSGAAPLLVGAYLMGQKSPVVKALGLGMIASGAGNVVSQFVPQTSAPVSEEVLADAVINEVINEDILPIGEDMNEDLNEDLNEELTGFEDGLNGED